MYGAVHFWSVGTRPLKNWVGSHDEIYCWRGISGLIGSKWLRTRKVKDVKWLLRLANEVSISLNFARSCSAGQSLGLCASMVSCRKNALRFEYTFSGACTNWVALSFRSSSRSSFAIWYHNLQTNKQQTSCLRSWSLPINRMMIHSISDGRVCSVIGGMCGEAE